VSFVFELQVLFFWFDWYAIRAGENATHESVGTASFNGVHFVTAFAFNFDSAFYQPAFEQ
jgi:hypothetical protein